jgi:hypothetical protein
MGVFVGKWSPISGTGQANCGGQITSLPPNPGAILTFVQDGPSTLAATSSGAAGCTLELFVSGETASLAQAVETCPVNTGGSVSFTTFTLVFTPLVETVDGGDSSDAGVGASDAEPSVDASPSADGAADDASSGEDASADDASLPGDGGASDASSPGDAGADSAPTSSDAGTDGASSGGDAGAGSNVQLGTLDWQLGDSDGTCLTTLHYTLVRSP